MGHRAVSAHGGPYGSARPAAEEPYTCFRARQPLVIDGRYEMLRLNGGATHMGWAWTPIGSGDNHVPERFTPVRFSSRPVDQLERA